MRLWGWNFGLTPTRFSQQNPRKDPIIVLHDINTDSLRTLLRFMYNGEVNVTEEFLPILLKTAEALRISGLSTGSDASREDEVYSYILFIGRMKRHLEG